MYLKNIKAHGFKSFADKINIELDTKLTGIVGPNGSGKSNIVDAVRWVLGEQSVKSLRGDTSMTDIIFSGSKSRNPLNVASVTLVLDNSDNYLPLAFNEISIQRRVYKDGSNEYYLNNEKCRLKDILDLLVDSGFGKDSLNIISQGEVESIISSKPTDRRVLIEEAAGVLKYKKRKEEALRKLEKTHYNMNRVNDVINELEVQVEPLRIQKEALEKYLSVKEELEDLEISLITNDITNISFNYNNAKASLEEANNELIHMSANNSTNEAKIEEYKLKISKLDKEINLKQQELLNKTKEVEEVNSEKKIILERQKYKVEDQKLHDNLISLNEKKLKIENDTNLIMLEINSKNSELKTNNAKLEELNNELNNIKNDKNKLLVTLNEKNKNLIYLKNSSDSLRNAIDSNSNLPYSVRNVLNNPKLKGIHNIIGKLFEVEEKYATAISTVLGLASSNIVVDNEEIAKEAIKFLRENKLGRATFFPLNIIKPKGIEEYVLNKIKVDGFIGIASDLVKYDKKYYNIITNQLGNVIVVRDIDVANKISKLINHSYRIVSLDGELLHVGGSITGGALSNNRNIISDKYELEKMLMQINKVTNDIKIIEDKINILDNNYKAVEDKYYLANKNKLLLEEQIKNKENIIIDLDDDKNDIELEIKGINNMLNNTLSIEEENVINKFYEVTKEKDILSNTLSELIKSKNDLNDSLEEFEYSNKKENSLFNAKTNEIKEFEISINRMDVKLDNLLINLSETYSITYEEASLKYKLEIDEREARGKVNSLKRQINEIGVVNLAAKDEYERVNTRYEYLTSQREDLYNAENTLLEIIKEMDDIMESEFSKTFEIINNNFKETFRDLFNGGVASLKLTEPDNLLETGVEIVASPPGKSMKNIISLSGGEKTFTAISLLFAILKTRPVPFCLLDEIEAALDDANVASFCKYLNKFKDKTQFILITHKKKTMEYMDTLYGVTMQESGVSKLVSVKLEEIKE